MHKRPVGGTFSSGGDLLFCSLSTERYIDVKVEVDVKALNLVLTSLSTLDPLIPCATFAFDSELWQQQSCVFGLPTKFFALCYILL